MSDNFTRNIKGVKEISKQSLSTNQQNDLLSDNKDVYVRNGEKYERLTGSVKSVNGAIPNENGGVEIALEVNGNEIEPIPTDSHKSLFKITTTSVDEVIKESFDWDSGTNNIINTFNSEGTSDSTVLKKSLSGILRIVSENKQTNSEILSTNGKFIFNVEKDYTIKRISFTIQGTMNDSLKKKSSSYNMCLITVQTGQDKLISYKEFELFQLAHTYSNVHFRHSLEVLTGDVITIELI